MAEAVKSLIVQLQRCRHDKNLCEALRLRAYMQKQALESHSALGNFLVPTLVECGSLLDAHQVFGNLPYRNEHSWTSLISGYIDGGQPRHAFLLYRNMQQESVHPSNYTFLALLRGCAMLKELETGLQMHAEIVREGLDKDAFLGNTLVDLYGKCGALPEAHYVFGKLSIRDVVSWNALISGYAEHPCAEDAVTCFERMLSEGICPTDVTYVCTLKACTRLKDAQRGRSLHIEIVVKGFNRDIVIGNTLVDMYGKCGLLAEACKVFRDLPVRVSVSWNTMVTAYAEIGYGEKVLIFYRQMLIESISPSSVTFSCSLKACSRSGNLETGQEIHTEVIKRGKEAEQYIGTALVDMYAKCSSLIEAQVVFDKLSVQDVVSWAALMLGYAEHGMNEKVLECFNQMQSQGVAIDAFTYVQCLRACGNLGALEIGQAIHAEIKGSGLEKDVSVNNMLIEMYGQCGSPAEARRVFDKQTARDVVLYTTMIKAYGENHEGSLAVLCFETMQQQHVMPDTITFSCLLAACSHACLVIEGQKYFNMMKEIYGIQPTLDHFTYMVGLLARSGHVYEAERYAGAMQCLPCKEILGALLIACKVYGEVELGQRCFQLLVQVNKEDAGAYLMMADLYASAGRLKDAIEIEEMRNLVDMRKKPACASMVADGKLHNFLVDDNQSKGLVLLLEVLSLDIKHEGHVPDLDTIWKHG